MKNILASLGMHLYWERVEIEDNLPLTTKDFGWKVRWRMKHDQNPIFIKLQDKYSVKAYAEERGIRTAHTFYITDNPETIPFDSLPENFVIKANHGCGWNILCKKRQFYSFQTEVNFRCSNETTKYQLTQDKVIQHCKSWLKQRYSRTQWAYQHIVPKIIIEEYLYPREGDELKDYKFYTFGGKAKLIDILYPTCRQNHDDFSLI